MIVGAIVADTLRLQREQRLRAEHPIAYTMAAWCLLCMHSSGNDHDAWEYWRWQAERFIHTS